MIDLAGMPSYFRLTSSRLRKPLQDNVPYTTHALRPDLLRVRNAWDECQAKRDRDAIYLYLTAVFDLVAWWAEENRALERAQNALRLQNAPAQKALRLQNFRRSDHDEPFAAIIFCTDADCRKVGRRTRSKGSRVLRYAMEYKTNAEALAAFVQRKGGINACAARFTCCFGRGGRSDDTMNSLGFGAMRPVATQRR